MENRKSNKKEIITLYGILSFMLFCMYARFAAFQLADNNLGVLFLSYKNGFVSAGLLGTAWRVLNQITSVELMTYESVYYAAKWMMILYDVLVVILLTLIYRKSYRNKRQALYLITLSLIVFGGMFCSSVTMGSYDMYEVMVLLLILILLFSQRVQGAIVALVLLGMLIHPSFLFKCFPLVAVMLFYQYKKTGKKSYQSYLILSAAVAVVVFVASEISVWGVQTQQEEALAFGQLLSANPQNYDAALAGRTLRECSAILPEWGYRGNNYINLVIFLLMFSPYWMLGQSFCEHFYRQKMTEDQAKVYRLMQWGTLAIIPQLLLKITYGYFVAEVMIYYLILLMFYIAQEDELVLTQMARSGEQLKNRMPVAYVLLLYPLLFMPFTDVSILSGFDFIARIFGA